MEKSSVFELFRESPAGVRGQGTGDRGEGMKFIPELYG